ncbi:unnamed protein product [Caenorhabditis brenneri]
MDYFVRETLIKLDIAHRVAENFPTPEQLIYIRFVSRHANCHDALRNTAPESRVFEVDGLLCQVSARTFFDELRNVMEAPTQRRRQPLQPRNIY